MKRIILIVGLLALVAISAHAQIPTYAIQTAFSGTNAFGPQGGTNIAAVIDCRKQQNVTIQAVIGCSAAGGTNAIAYSTSVDGSTYSAVTLIPQYAIVGGQGNVIIQNINVAGAGYLKLNYVTNWFTDANQTNIVIKYGVKISAP